MIVERSMSDGWLSNAYLLADRPGGEAVLIDAGGPPEPLLEKIAALDVRPTRLLQTHHHVDHVQHADLYRERFGCTVHVHAAERDRFDHVDATLDDGETVRVGDLAVRAIHTPGHTVGQLAFAVDDRAVFTGDTLFRESVGGTLAPGHATFEDLRRSIMDRLMTLPPSMRVYPGHTDGTTIGHEWDHNPFVRAWRGVDPIGERPCRVRGRPAQLLLRAGDYDGGSKCWVRFDDDGAMAVVGGSLVEETG